MKAGASINYRLVLIAMIVLFGSCQGGNSGTSKKSNLVVPGTGIGKGQGGVNGNGNGASGGVIPLPPNMPPSAGPPPPPPVVNSCPSNCLTCNTATYCI